MDMNRTRNWDIRVPKRVLMCIVRWYFVTSALTQFRRVSVVQICTYERKLQEIGKIPESISPSASNEKRPLLRSSEFGSHEGHESATTAWMTFLFFSFTIRIRRPQCSLRVSVLPYWWVFKATMWSASVLHQPQFPSLIFAEYHVALPPKTLRPSSCDAGAAITNVTSVATKARNENCIAKKEVEVIFSLSYPSLPFIVQPSR